MYAKLSSMSLVDFWEGLLEMNLKTYSSHHFHRAGTAKIWSFGMEHSPLGTQKTWWDDVRGCLCPNMLPNGQMLCNALHELPSESWEHGKRRTCQMLCRLQRCCDYCLWFRKIIAQIYIKYRATSKINWSMTLGTDLCPRRPLYFVNFVSSQSIKTGVQPASILKHELVHSSLSMPRDLLTC